MPDKYPWSSPWIISSNLEMVEEVFDKSFWINPSHIPTHYKAHTVFKYIWKYVDFLTFNQKFPFNTKMNKVDNNKVKLKYIYENDIMKG